MAHEACDVYSMTGWADISAVGGRADWKHTLPGKSGNRLNPKRNVHGQFNYLKVNQNGE